MSQTPNKKQLQVSTYSLAPAVYLLRVQTSNGTQIVQLVKR
ncbi:MAG: T9SS type A sorting domain-containing protein [Flavobacteriaceae bacterium]